MSRHSAKIYKALDNEGLVKWKGNYGYFRSIKLTKELERIPMCNKHIHPDLRPFYNSMFTK